jgi:glucose/arabinose dehydrogenase
MSALFRSGFVLFLLHALLFSCSGADSTSTNSSSAFPEIRLESVVKGLNQPLGLVHAGDGSGRLFIVEQTGTIRIYQDGVLIDKPFLDLTDRVTSGDETGLLGLAFHPKFSENHRLFVNYTSPVGGLHTVISEFTVGNTPAEADKNSERILLTISQPFANHNGGDVVFGPDGYLYIGMGDGGSGYDPQGNGQNLATLLGKMLRIDVDQKTAGKEYGIPADNPLVGTNNAAPEIWAYGLRNPWRFSFDPATGLLYVGDVGQSDREEIDEIRKGRNYGWNVMEGTICTPGVNPVCDKSPLEPPIIDYPRSEGTTVIGGGVYRGKAIPDLAGAYLYGDFGSGRLWALRYDGKEVTGQRLLLETGKNISSFGEDEQGEHYLVDYGGEIFKIMPGP